MIKNSFYYILNIRYIIYIIRDMTILCFALCLLCSCDIFIYVGKFEMTMIESNGHTYVVCKRIGYSEIQMIHDPDCKCKDKE
jgi:hypothetical protein